MRPPKPATMPTISHSQTSSTASSTTANSNTTPPTSSSPTYVCIECTYPVKTLYTAYSSADDRQLGRGVRLTQCPRCKRFADKYVEHDFVVLFIDLVLIKPQVTTPSLLTGPNCTSFSCTGPSIPNTTPQGLPSPPLQPTRPPH